MSETSAEPILVGLTFDEYLAFEEASPLRHEFVRGAVYAMTGAIYGHHRIVRNVGRALETAAGRGPCDVFRESFKLRIGDDVYYPDVMVACREAFAFDARWATHPCLVVEVLSRGRARTDRVEKLDAYRAIPTLGAYLVIDSAYRRVERHWRDGDGAWRTEAVTEGAVPVPCPATALALDAIYDGVDVVPRPPLRRLKETLQPAP